MASVERLINAAQGNEIIHALNRINDSENGRDEYDTSKVMLNIYQGNVQATYTYSYNGAASVTVGVASKNNVIFCDPDTDLTINISPFTTSTKVVCDATFSWPTPNDGYVTNTQKTVSPNDSFRIHLPSVGVGGFQFNGNFNYAWGCMAGTQIQMTTGLPTMTITFNANGGTGTAPEDIVLPVYSDYTLPANTFTREGYAFMGWSTDPDAGLVGTSTDRGEDTDIPQSVWLNKGSQTRHGDHTDLTFYAIWTDKLFVNVKAVPGNVDVYVSNAPDKSGASSTRLYYVYNADGKVTFTSNIGTVGVHEYNKNELQEITASLTSNIKYKQHDNNWGYNMYGYESYPEARSYAVYAKSISLDLPGTSGDKSVTSSDDYANALSLTSNTARGTIPSNAVGIMNINWGSIRVGYSYDSLIFGSSLNGYRLYQTAALAAPTVTGDVTSLTWA